MMQTPVSGGPAGTRPRRDLLNHPSRTTLRWPLLDDLIRATRPALDAVSHSGATIPGCPPAGLQLLPGFPAPYGFYSTNPANNWCMPYGPDNGCTAFPDTRSVDRGRWRHHDLQ